MYNNYNQTFLTHSILFGPFFHKMKNITKPEFRVPFADNKLVVVFRNLGMRLWPWQVVMDKNETKKMRAKLSSLPLKVIFVLCIASFFAGSLFSSRNSTNHQGNKEGIASDKLSLATQNPDHKRVSHCLLSWYHNILDFAWWTN